MKSVLSYNIWTQTLYVSVSNCMCWTSNPSYRPTVMTVPPCEPLVWLHPTFLVVQAWQSPALWSPLVYKHVILHNYTHLKIVHFDITLLLMVIENDLTFYCFIVQLILPITRCKIIPYVRDVLHKFKRKYKKYTKDLSKDFCSEQWGRLCL